MISETPADAYKNTVVLYYWRDCQYCKDLMPRWISQVRPALQSRNVDIREIEVLENKTQLIDLNVKLTGVPTIVFYNHNGEASVFTGNRTPHDIVAAADVHITRPSIAGGANGASVSPAVVQANLPATVLYFRDSCGHCRNFAPTFSEFSHLANVGNTFRVDVTLHPSALSDLHPAARSPGVPHVVYHDSSGMQTPFVGERTVSSLQKFVKQQTSSSRHVRFAGGSNEAGHTPQIRSALWKALNKLQDSAASTFGSGYRRVFEPERSQVEFIGVQRHDNAANDRVYILLSPFRKPRGTPPIHACIYGTLHRELTTKIYINKNIEVLLQNKRRTGYEPESTNAYSNILKTFGYDVASPST